MNKKSATKQMKNTAGLIESIKKAKASQLQEIETPLLFRITENQYNSLCDNFSTPVIININCQPRSFIIKPMEKENNVDIDTLASCYNKLIMLQSLICQVQGHVEFNPSAMMGLTDIMADITDSLQSML